MLANSDVLRAESVAGIMFHRCQHQPGRARQLESVSDSLGLLA